MNYFVWQSCDGLRLAIRCGLIVGLCINSAWTFAAEWHGLLDIRAVASDGKDSWTREGLGKQRFDRNSDGIRIGQAILRTDVEVTDTLTASIIATASDDRRNLVDVTEAWLAWNPIPSGPWKTRVKAGAFFPTTSIEIDYESVGWTPTRTLSSSAINSWIGDEIRTKGLEFNMSHKGRFSGSANDFGFTAAVFQGNDPIGSLLAWRGWTISDRISGVSEPIRLADLPVYRANGALAQQSRTIHVFREIDHRPGYYVGAQYSRSGVIELAALHYDNRGQPLKISNGQYSWATSFDHLSARLMPGNDWELLVQAMRGTTLMGPGAVDLGYRSWYTLLSHPLGKGSAAMRYDNFNISDHDHTPQDPNGERGHSLALAYTYPLNQSLSLVAEVLRVGSNRDARALIGIATKQSENSLSAALRWQF